MRISGARTRVSLWVLIFVACLVSVAPVANAQAAITARSLTLEANATAVAAKLPSASAPSIHLHADSTGLANHHFKFTVATTSGVQAIGFQYCTAAYQVGATCTAPTDLDAHAATVGTLVGISGATFHTTSNNVEYVSVSSVSSNDEITLVGVYNPSVNNKTFFVWLTTYTSTSSPTVGTTTPQDQGTVAASTATPIVLSGTMPEALTFCAAATITVDVSNVPQCSSATNGTVNFAQLFDASSTATATSMMAASTNAGSGYSITYYGDTLKNGTNFLAAIGSTATTSNPGHSQFGLNAALNPIDATHGITTAFGSGIGNPGVSGNTYNGQTISPYATGDSFAFVANTATAVANSNSLVSDLEMYTVSYIANVNGAQAAGVYSTTLTYVCTPTY